MTLLKRVVFATTALVCLSEPLRSEAAAEEEEVRVSINSPRNASLEGPDKGDILVRLPDNIQEQMNWHKKDRDRMREAILGFPVEAPTSSTAASTVSTTRQSTPGPRTPAAATTTTTRRRYIHPKEVEGGGRRRVTTAKPPPKKDVFKDKAERTVWSVAWEAHVYFSGTLFVLLAIYCSVNMARLHTFSRLFSRGYFVALNACLVLIGVIRPVWLFHDPYNANLAFPRMAAYLLADTGFPCITSAFAILFLAMLRATQVELISPAFQTPKALGGFCLLHFLLSFGVDVTIGFMFHLRYMVLILQGIFIVWSLLLSAGYFYIFSAMHKIAMRQQGACVRTMYPKLILEGTASSYSDRGQLQPSSAKAPPLARAVQLTLGVAVLGCLLGGIQLFSMIKMLGLVKQDMAANQNEWAWYGYQVSMRVLEVMICTLLAVIATTPLRSDFEGGAGTFRMGAANSYATGGGVSQMQSMPNGYGHHQGVRVCGVVGMTQLDYETDSVGGCYPAKRRGWLLCCCGGAAGGSNPPRAFEDEIYSEICSNNHSVRQVMQDQANRYSTLARPVAASVAIPLGAMNGGGCGDHHPAASMAARSSSTLMVPYNHKRGAAALNHFQTATLVRTNFHDVMPASAMVVGQPVMQMAQQPQGGGSGSSSRATIDTALYSNLRPASRPSSMLFNDSGFVRFRMGDNKSPSNLSSEDLVAAATAAKQQPALQALRASQSFDDSVLLVDEDDEKCVAASKGAAAMYEPLPARVPAAAGQHQQKVAAEKSTPSESDETAYGRAPSQCSSTSATQSFDMRMYGGGGRSKAGGGDGQQKLQNPYYYYGSTRNQKVGAAKKPRPLLPSQRQALDLQPRPASRNEFQRSQSLGGHYATRDLPPTPEACRPPFAAAAMPIHRAFHQEGVVRPVGMSPMGSLTPGVGRVVIGGRRRKHNPLYDTPPLMRRPPPNFHFLHEGGDAHPLPPAPPPPPPPRAAAFQMPHLMPYGNPGLASSMVDPLSPILTDQEGGSSVRHSGQGFLTTSDDNNLSSSSGSSGSSSSEGGRRRRKRRRNVSRSSAEGLADASEAETPGAGATTSSNRGSFVSPLEYAAMLKLEKSSDLPKSSRQQQQGYSRVATNEDSQSEAPDAGGSSLFSSSSESDEGGGGDGNPPRYRWDGSRIEQRKNAVGDDVVSEEEEADVGESESVFTEDGMDEDDSALADVETDYDDESRSAAATGGGGGQLLARRNLEEIQKNLERQKQLEASIAGLKPAAQKS